MTCFPVKLPSLKTNIASQKWWLEDYFPLGRPIFRGYVSFKDNIRVYNPNRWVTLEKRRRSNCFSPRPRHRLLHIPGLVFTLGVFLLVGTWDIREGQWLRSTSEMTKLCFFRIKGEFFYIISTHLFLCLQDLQDTFTDERHVWCVRVRAKQHMLLVIFNSYISFSCHGWDLVADHLGFHTFCSFEPAARLLHCMHFVDCIISLMSQVRIFSHGLLWGLEQGFSSQRYYICS